MKALVKTELGQGNLHIQNVEEPDVSNYQVKIKVAYAGICGSDIHTYEGHYKVAAPVTLGHEFSGEIVEVGSGVTGFKVGDRVTSETTFYICGKCRYCQTGDYNLCNHRKGLGTQQNGGFTNYLIAREESLHHIPEEVDDRSASMTEPLACTYHAIQKTNIKEGDLVVVLGPGPIGLLAAQVAKSYGATVMMSGLNNDKIRLDKAKEVGVDHVINIQEEDIKEKIATLTDGYGADVVLECSGSIHAANQGLDLLRKKGSYAQVGIFPESHVNFDMGKVIQKEIQVVGSRSQKSADWEPSIQLMKEKKVDAKALVTHEFTIDQWDEAYQAIKGGEAIKVLLKPLQD
ncbi:zinc-binding dehydrogenase [Oceanobacillus kimchii]|uniref:Alcohol dehydrogenase catalytic domain-containing protein n=1 Tax=Oceanobacillus kimchii TaxID=746691 RepID=A0ABQ5TNR4_9BACI|nr:zinc-binding dehydrogenase [Oceanobacillus kimchii]GLO67406.1 alcohol dehydrogenase catalytic domain-containing protein [Oceanobacillus kimchii]